MQLKIEIDKKSIGRRLKTARESFGLTQEKLSEEMGCTSKYISKVENGASAPSLPFVIKFSEISETIKWHMIIPVKHWRI